MEPVLLPVAVVEAPTTWIDAHDEAGPGVIESLCVVGSVALDDWAPHSDIDVVAVVVADPSDPDLVDELAAAHRLVREQTEIAIDGLHVAWGDLVVPPVAVHRPPSEPRSRSSDERTALITAFGSSQRVWMLQR